MPATPEEHQIICEAIQEGENIAKRITDLVAKLKPLVDSERLLKLVQAEPPLCEDSEVRDQTSPPVIANELKGY